MQSAECPSKDASDLAVIRKAASGESTSNPTAPPADRPLGPGVRPTAAPSVAIQSRGTVLRKRRRIPRFEPALHRSAPHRRVVPF